MTNPDELVAERMISEFRKAKILSDGGIKKIEQTLSSGKLSAEDWALVFETDRATEEKGHASKGQ